MKLDELEKWDRRMIELALTVGGWSKGPRKRVGAVITRPDRSVASMGYNGPPRGYDDEAFLKMTRDEQHKVVVHAEMNAIKQMNAIERYIPFKTGYTFYIAPLYPCYGCAVKLANYGFERVVAYCGHISEDWARSSAAAEQVFHDNNIKYIMVKS